MQLSDRVVVNEATGTLSFTKLVKSEDEGQYTCRAVNDVGEDTAVGHLHVKGENRVLSRLCHDLGVI